MKRVTQDNGAAVHRWRHRGRRLASGLNTWIAVALALALLVMVNYLASRHYARWDISAHRYYKLSGKTTGMLAGLKGDLTAIMFFRRGHALYSDVRNLLKEYAYAAARNPELRFNLQVVDPERDLGRVRELMEKYDVPEANVVVFETQGRQKYVDARALAEYDYSMEGGKAVKSMAAFRGEEAFSSAILGVVESARPVIGFLTGHGERDPDDYGESAGYSGLARAMRRDTIEFRPVALTEEKGVPKECAALVIAGPRRPLVAAEVEMLATYLAQSGRLMVLADAGSPTGLEPLLEKWGIRLGNGAAVDPRQTLTGRELFITRYGDHPITRRLGKLGAILYLPRSMSLPAADMAETADRPRITVLAACSESGWEETNLSQNPARFDAASDRRGPVPVAVALERGVAGGLAVEVKPTRLVVVGDSDFVANGALASGAAGNLDVFMSALNWLLERENLMGIPPRAPNELRLNMSRRQINLAMLAVVLGVPGVAAVFGLLVWWRRRR